MERYVNNVSTTLNGGINDAVTSLTLTSATGFPTAGTFRLLIDSEILLATAISGTTVTVTRGAENTVAASHSNGSTITCILTAESLTLVAAPYPLMIVPGGVELTSTTIASDAGTGFAMPILIPATMLVDKLGFQVTTGGSGTVEWGLFDFSLSASSATKLAGGSGALSSTGYQTVAATGAPVTVRPGGYMLIFKMPAANNPSVRRTEWSGSNAIPVMKFQSAYVWDDTPDLTSGWTTDSVAYNVVLHGRLASGTTW